MKYRAPERRRFIRIEVPLEVQLTSDIINESSYSKNISPIGMCCEVTVNVPVGYVLNTFIKLPGSEELISAQAKVVWVKRISLEDDSNFDIGLVLNEIDEKQKKVLLKYLCDILYDSAYGTGL
ncbi:MAG: PilZ domain-containing protein [Candidatus Omnitrophica bacterium]|nr:PilZ domain-containing protein [Candidatus Omnitrophota bacterium]